MIRKIDKEVEQSGEPIDPGLRHVLIILFFNKRDIVNLLISDEILIVVGKVE